jgi:hypothetical protein
MCDFGGLPACAGVVIDTIKKYREETGDGRVVWELGRGVSARANIASVKGGEVRVVLEKGEGESREVRRINLYLLRRGLTSGGFQILINLMPLMSYHVPAGEETEEVAGDSGTAHIRGWRLELDIFLSDVRVIYRAGTLHRARV